MNIQVQTASIAATWHDYLELTKPRIVALIVLTSLVGSLLAAPGLPRLDTLLFANLGIALAAAGAAVINHVLDRGIDARMRRTQYRPLPTGHLKPAQALLFALALERRFDAAAGTGSECADGRADICIAPRLCGDLHGVAQAQRPRRTS